MSSWFLHHNNLYTWWWPVRPKHVVTIKRKRQENINRCHTQMAKKGKTKSELCSATGCCDLIVWNYLVIHVERLRQQLEQPNSQMGFQQQKSDGLCSVTLLIYGLFTNAVNSSDCVPSKSRIGAWVSRIGFGRKRSWRNMRHHTSTCLKGLGKPRKMSTRIAMSQLRLEPSIPWIQKRSNTVLAN
jgi:hypothetical protein